MNTENTAEKLSGSGDGDASTRSRGPAVPTVNLQKALDLMRIVWAEEKRNAAPVSSIVTHWGYKPKSSGGLQAIASLKRFGLLDEQGSGDKRTLKLSQIALDVLKNETVDAAEYARLLKDVALAPKFHRLMWDNYGAEMPSEQTLEKKLVFDMQFSEDAAKHFVREYKDTLAFARMLDDDTFKEPGSDLFDTLAPPDKGLLTATPATPPPSSNVTAPPNAASPSATASTPRVAPTATPGIIKYFTIPTDIGDAMIPMGMSEEDFKLFGEALTLFKKKIVKASRYPIGAVWRNADHDKPVTIVGEMGERDGVKYYESQGGTGIPENELTFAL